MIKTSNAGISHDSNCGVIIKSLPDTWLNNGSNETAINKAINVAANVTIIDSVRNWAISCLRAEPSTLRTPTSRARFDDLAVERFIKFTQAISKIKMATAENI